MPGYPNEQYLVDTHWLNTHLDDDQLRVLDVRFDIRLGASGALEEVPGKECYVSGHIPGAQFVDLLADLTDPQQPNHIIEPDAFASLMNSLGIGPASTVVLYDDKGGVWAARLWWALRYYGHKDVKMLNGGLTHWLAAGFATESGPAVEKPIAQFITRTQAGLRAAKEDVLAAIDNPDTRIVDALPEIFYRGDMGLYPGLRTGHVPGARNVPTEDNLDPQTLCVKSMGQLEELWRTAAIEPEQSVITYCGGGVFAAFALFILALMGHEKAALYDASWREWGADDNLPIEAGTQP